MDLNEATPLYDDQLSPDRPEKDADVKTLVRLKKSIVIQKQKGNVLDPSYIDPGFYQRFNYSLLPDNNLKGKIAIGVTSPNPSEGKTLVTANLAVSLALANQKDTVILDMNIDNPRLNEVFGVPLGPGLLEALDDTSIHVTPTAVDNLYILPVGEELAAHFRIAAFEKEKSKSTIALTKPSMGLEQLTAFRDVLYTLQESFDIVVAELPSIEETRFPSFFMRQFSGIIVVVIAGQTKREEIDKLLFQLNQDQVIGFVFNRASKRILP